MSRLSPEAFLREAALVAAIAASLLFIATLLLSAALALATPLDDPVEGYQMKLVAMSCCGAEEVLGPYVTAAVIAPAAAFMLAWVNRSRSRRLREVTIVGSTNHEGV